MKSNDKTAYKKNKKKTTWIYIVGDFNPLTCSAPRQVCVRASGGGSVHEPPGCSVAGCSCCQEDP